MSTDRELIERTVTILKTWLCAIHSGQLGTDYTNPFSDNCGGPYCSTVVIPILISLGVEKI